MSSHSSKSPEIAGTWAVKHCLSFWWHAWMVVVVAGCALVQGCNGAIFRIKPGDLDHSGPWVGQNVRMLRISVRKPCVALLRTPRMFSLSDDLECAWKGFWTPLLDISLPRRSSMTSTWAVQTRPWEWHKQRRLWLPRSVWKLRQFSLGFSGIVTCYSCQGLGTFQKGEWHPRIRERSWIFSSKTAPAFLRSSDPLHRRPNKGRERCRCTPC